MLIWLGSCVTRRPELETPKGLAEAYQGGRSMQQWRAIPVAIGGALAVGLLDED